MAESNSADGDGKGRPAAAIAWAGNDGGMETGLRPPGLPHGGGMKARLSSGSGGSDRSGAGGARSEGPHTLWLTRGRWPSLPPYSKSLAWTLSGTLSSAGKALVALSPRFQIREDLPAISCSFDLEKTSSSLPSGSPTKVWRINAHVFPGPIKLFSP